MSQEPASSQRSFHSAAEEWEQDSDLSNTLAGDNDLLHDDTLDDYGAPQPFENPPQKSEWDTHEDPIYSASYQHIIKQINEFTGPKGYAVGVRNAKRRGKDGDLIKKLYYRAYIKYDRLCPKKKTFDEFARVRETTSRNWNCEWAGVIYRTTARTWKFYIHTPNGVTKDTHNHPPSISAASHPTLRRAALAPLQRTFINIPTR